MRRLRARPVGTEPQFWPAGGLPRLRAERPRDESARGAAHHVCRRRHLRGIDLPPAPLLGPATATSETETIRRANGGAGLLVIGAALLGGPPHRPTWGTLRGILFPLPHPGGSLFRVSLSVAWLRHRG